MRSIAIRFEGKAEDELSLAIKNHVEAHENVTLIDIVKFLYQSVLGSFHLLDRMNEREIKGWINESLATVEPERRPLTERMYGNKWVRLNLGAFKHVYGSNGILLTSLFLKGKEEGRVPMKEFSRKLNVLLKLVTAGKIKSSCQCDNLSDLFLVFLSEYKQIGFPPVHHSKLYSERNPKYVVVPRNSLTDLEGNYNNVSRNNQMCGLH